MRALIIDDDKDIRDFLKLCLGAEGLAVDTAEDGKKGSRLARTNDYDIIVLDNILPEKSGLGVCHDIRHSGKEAPILILSVKSDTATKVELLNEGADDYLVKPFAVDELVAHIRALLRRPKQIKGEIFQIDDLVLDTKKHTVTRAGKEVRLTHKEFALLEYLMRNHGFVLSRGMILEHVWDMYANTFSNTIESHIARLRRKINSRAKGSKNLIHTVPGRGYKIDSSKSKMVI